MAPWKWWPLLGEKGRDIEAWAAENVDVADAEARFKVGGRWLKAIGTDDGNAAPRRCGCTCNGGSCTFTDAARRALFSFTQSSIVDVLLMRDAEEVTASLARVLCEFSAADDDASRDTPGGPCSPAPQRPPHQDDTYSVGDVAAVAAVLLLFAGERDALRLLRALMAACLRCRNGRTLAAASQSFARAAIVSNAAAAFAVGEDALALSLETLAPKWLLKLFVDAVPLSTLVALWDECFTAIALPFQGPRSPARNLAPRPQNRSENDASAADRGSQAVVRCGVALVAAAACTLCEAAEAAASRRSLTQGCACDDKRFDAALAYAVVSELSGDSDVCELSAALKRLDLMNSPHAPHRRLDSPNPPNRAISPGVAHRPLGPASRARSNGASPSRLSRALTASPSRLSRTLQSCSSTALPARRNDSSLDATLYGPSGRLNAPLPPARRPVSKAQKPVSVSEARRPVSEPNRRVPRPVSGPARLPGATALSLALSASSVDDAKDDDAPNGAPSRDTRRSHDYAPPLSHDGARHEAASPSSTGAAPSAGAPAFSAVCLDRAERWRQIQEVLQHLKSSAPRAAQGTPRDPPARRMRVIAAPPQTAQGVASHAVFSPAVSSCADCGLPRPPRKPRHLVVRSKASCGFYEEERPEPEADAEDQASSGQCGVAYVFTYDSDDSGRETDSGESAAGDEAKYDGRSLGDSDGRPRGDSGPLSESRSCGFSERDADADDDARPAHARPRLRPRCDNVSVERFETAVLSTDLSADSAAAMRLLYACCTPRLAAIESACALFFGDGPPRARLRRLLRDHARPADRFAVLSARAATRVAGTLRAVSAAAGLQTSASQIVEKVHLLRHTSDGAVCCAALEHAALSDAAVARALWVDGEGAEDGSMAAASDAYKGFSARASAPRHSDDGFTPLKPRGSGVADSPGCAIMLCRPDSPQTTCAIM